jgi:beta-glucosidase
MNTKNNRHCVRRALVILLSFVLFLTATVPALAYSGNISASVLAHAMSVAKEIQAEGIVLLKNEGDVLPLNNKKVNVFGTGSINPFIGGTGSGAVTTLDPIDFYESLDMAGIQYNTEIKDIYQQWYKPRAMPSTSSSVVNNGIQYVMLGTSLPEMPVSKLPAPVLAKAQAYSDTAIIMISRTGSESADFSEEDLRITAEEAALVELVTSSFGKVIILFNTANIMEMGWLESYESIKAAVLICIPGEVGFESVGKMLKGVINPSGKLADTVAYQTADHPSNQNFGNYTYKGTGLSAAKFVDYEEGIYVGYRYFETFAPEKVQYPFGFGLSYTDFKWETLNFTANAQNVSVTVKVTNTGNMAGKDVVQLYYAPPYTPGGIEKSAIVLGGYAKTTLIQPGRSDTVTVRFNTRDMASYDDRGEGAWVLDSGKYLIRVSTTVRDFTDTFAYTVNTKKVYNADDTTGAPLGNLFDSARGDLTYFSRADAAGTYPRPPVNPAAPNAVRGADDLPAPLTAGTVPATGVKHESGVITLADVAKDDTLWDAFLDQLTVDEMINMIANSGYKTSGVKRLGIPQTVDNDGPAAVKGKNGILYRDSGVAYPAATVLAYTWNDALAKKFGESVGLDAADIGTDIWYAPGANIHRNPRGGRNFEYYSEDPLLSGRICAAVVKGAQSQKLLVTTKHFAVNDQETNRTGLFTWSNEQALREIYFKPFELAVKRGGALGMMSGFNRIGTQWCGASRSLLVDLLRVEWGFKGFVVTDFSFNFTGTGYMNPALAVYGRNNAILSGLWFIQAPSAILSMKATYNCDPAGFGTALRECVKDLCYIKMRTKSFTALTGIDIPAGEPADSENPASPEIPQTGVNSAGIVPILFVLSITFTLIQDRCIIQRKKINKKHFITSPRA